MLTTNQVYPHAVDAVASEPVPTGACVTLTVQRPGIGRTNTDS